MQLIFMKSIASLISKRITYSVVEIRTVGGQRVTWLARGSEFNAGLIKGRKLKVGYDSD